MKLAIDTHKTVLKLKQKGYTEEQAEGFIDALTESDLVTTTYLDSKIKELRSEIRESRSQMTLLLLIHGFATIAAIVEVAKIL